ncbi:MAG: dihydrodipicolinate synthase family protein [Eubacteriales bacterium]|nr:dihydrodipicolinate synthase family protein [Eubacteriales bacterium]
MKHLNDIVIPIITPLTENDTIDVPSLERLTEYMISKGVDCLYPCGTTGEMVYLTDEERMLVTETVVRTAKGRVTVFAQVGAANTASTIKLAQHAVACGADGIGVVTPWYFQLSDKALVDYYCEVSQSVPDDFPIYLYSIPQNAVNDINADTAEKIAQKCKNVLGIKYSYPNMTRLQEMMTVRGGDFDVLVGPDHLYEALVAVGGKGVVSGNAMIIPEHYIAVRDAMAKGDWQTATKAQRRTNILNSILCAKNNIGCYKVVLKDLGVISTTKMRKPMEEVSADDAKKLLADLCLADYKNVRL